MWLWRIDAKIAALQQRQAEEEHGRLSRPKPPEWIVELGIGIGRPPVQVHAGDCYMAGKRRRPVTRDEARRLLATGVKACTHCQPDGQLGILDLPARWRRTSSRITGARSGLARADVHHAAHAAVRPARYRPGSAHQWLRGIRASREEMFVGFDISEALEHAYASTP